MSVKRLPAYVFSMDNVTNVATPNNYLSIFNPVGNPHSVIITGVFVSATLLTSSSITASLRGWRISAASGGTLRDPDTFSKAQTHFPDATAEVRTGNPTCTLATALFNSPSPTADKANWVHEVGVGSLASPFVAMPGEGIVLRSEAGIGVGATWNMSIVWAEGP